MEQQYQQSAPRAAFTAPAELPQGDVFRQVAFPVRSFDYLKQFQRGYEAKHGIRLTNNQTLTVIIREHQEQNDTINGESGAHGSEQSKAQ